MQTANKINFLKDVIHNEIIFEQDWVADVLKTKEFVRLSKLKQLGLSSRIFPNAIHTRYAHSLGVYALANSVVKQLGVFNKDEVNEIVAAALLHDLGHGPHSHAFEEYTGINHEQYSKAIILDKNTEVNKILVKNKINPQHVCDILDHKHKNNLINDLISGQIDVDRLDYLARDSYLTGVSYGHIDSSIILKWMLVKENKICFNFKAISSIENLLISRYHMFERVYEQPKIVALQSLIKKMLKRFKYIYNNNKKSIVNKNNMVMYFEPWLIDKNFTVDQYLNIDDIKFEMFIEQMQYEKDEYIKEAYKLYTRFLNTDYHTIDDTSANYNKFVKELSKKTKFPDLYIHKCKIKTKQIYKSKQEPILIYDRFDQKIKKLDKVSMIINKLSDKSQSLNVLVINNHI